MPAEAHEIIKRSQVDSPDVEDFIDKVSEVSRLIDGLKAGTISTDFVDTKLADSSSQRTAKSVNSAKTKHTESSQPQQDTADDREGPDADQQAELQRKLAELKSNRERKAKVRQLYQQHTEQDKQHYATDYTKWDLFCPSDEEDDMFNSIAPNTPQFRAMEKDINDRHNRMVEQRQIAERQRQQGNAAFKAKQYSEALRCYELGLGSQKHNMALHANAAQAALKLNCYVQALEHCDKVLHLAEVLYNKPKDPLCVKALQRRAAAYQALEQHSKAVDDLKAAAAILPGDKEISDQLQRAERLLSEYRAAKKLKGMAAAGADAEAADKSSTHLPLSTLQRIEQLVAALNKVDEEQQQAAAADGADICHELQGLVQQASSCCLYFRECGGVAAVIKQVMRPVSSKALAAALQLLATACDNPTATEQLAQQQQLLAAALNQISSADTAVSAAAIGLLYTVSTAATGRQEICKQLLDRRTARGGATASADCSCSSCSRLETLWDSCGQAAASSDATQVLATSLLSNCLLVPAVKEASRQLLAQKPGLLDRLISRLDSGTATKSKSTQSAVVEKLYGLLSNLCAHAALRQQLAAHGQLLMCAKTAAIPSQGQAASSMAALAFLCNLSLEPRVQQQLACDSQVMNTLLAWACGGPTAVESHSAGTSSSSKSRPIKAGPQLPDRKRQQEKELQHSQLQQPGAADVQLLRRQRAACLLSRAAKQQEGVKVLQANTALVKLLQCLTEQLQLRPQAKEQIQMSQSSDDSGASKAAWVEAVVRTIALLTAQPGTCKSFSSEQAASAIKVCLDLLQSAEAGEATTGNAALCLSHFAAEARWHQQLHNADAVKALVDVAYAGRGNATSENAAIALAKLAKDQRMMERLRELHGLEIIYQYVRV